VFVGIAAFVADGDAGIFGHFFDLADELFAAVGGGRGDIEADGAAVGLGVEAEVGDFDGFDDGFGGGGVEGFDEDLGGFGDADGGEVFEVGGAAVVVDFDVVDQGGGGASGADASEFFAEVFEGFIHSLAALAGNFLDGHGFDSKIRKNSEKLTNLGPGAHDSGLNCVLKGMRWFYSVGDEGADVLAFDGAADVAGGFEVEDNDGDVLFEAHGEGGEIHDAELFFDGFLEGEVVVAGGVGVFVRGLRSRCHRLWWL